MNLQCPHCQKMLTVPDQYAGQLMKCPLCSNTFTAPALPAAPPVRPAVAVPSGAVLSGVGPQPSAAPPPAEDLFRQAPSASTAPSEPPLPPGDSFNLSQPPAPESSAPPPLPAEGYSHTLTIWISPRVVPWIGPAGLVLGFILSFFTWLLVPKNEVKEFGAWGLAFRGTGNGLLICYDLLLVVAVLLALAAVVLPRLSVPLPPALQQIMPWRSGIVGGLTLLAFFFLLLQLVIGFGEETVSEGVLQAYRTNWLRLAFLVNLAAAVGTALEFWLALRKSRPLPRIDISW